MRRRRRRRAAASPREGPQAASLRKLRPELCAYRGYRSRSRTHGEGGWPATRVRLVQSLRKQLPEYMVCCRKIDLIRGRQPAAAPWRRAATRRTARSKPLRSAAGRCNKARDRQNTLRSCTIDLARGRRAEASRCGGPQFDKHVHPAGFAPITDPPLRFDPATIGGPQSPATLQHACGCSAGFAPQQGSQQPRMPVAAAPCNDRPRRIAPAVLPPLPP